jgi:hypothetical protein
LTPRWQFDPANRALDEARRLLDGSRAISSPPVARAFCAELFRMWAYMQARETDIVNMVAQLGPEVDAQATLGERGVSSQPRVAQDPSATLPSRSNDGGACGAGG